MSRKGVEAELRLREQVRPAIGRKRNVARREGGDEVVLGSLDGPLCRSEGSGDFEGGLIGKGGRQSEKRR